MYYSGAIILFLVYYFGTFIIVHYFESAIPLMISNVILFFVWMGYIIRKWEEKEKGVKKLN